MNASRLRELAELLLGREQNFKVQEILNDLNSNLSNLAGNPQDAGAQTNFATSLERLKSATSGMVASFQPAQLKLLEEIGASQYFSTDLSEQISKWVRENPITPAVTQKHVAALAKTRGNYIQDITQLKEKLERLHISAAALPEGSAEIGVLLPRQLFHNHLDELVKELGVLNLIFRIFSEVATGTAQPIEVHQISTTDPQFFFGIDPTTVAALGGAVTWALSQWKKVEEIRKLRSETKKNQSFTEAEIKNFFDSKIEKAIKESIQEKITELIGPPQKGVGRGHEIRGQLEWALESILARVERGMTVEVKFVPPPSNPAIDKEGVPPTETAFSKLEQVASELVFPMPDKTPVLELPPPEPEKAPKPKQA